MTPLEQARAIRSGFCPDCQAEDSMKPVASESFPVFAGDPAAAALFDVFECSVESCKRQVALQRTQI